MTRGTRGATGRRRRRALPALLPLLLTLAAAAALAGCKPELQTETFTLHSLAPSQARALARPYVLGSSGEVTVSGRPPALTVTGSRRSIDAVRAMLERYDRPPAAIRLHYQLVEADGAGAPDSSIADVVAALHQLFRYRGYRLLADAYIQTTEGQASSQQLATSAGMRYTLIAVAGRVSTDSAGAPTVSIETHLRDPGHRDVLGSTVTVQSGHTLVIGSARPDPRQGALILVLRPTILEGKGRAPGGRQ